MYRRQDHSGAVALDDASFDQALDNESGQVVLRPMTQGDIAPVVDIICRAMNPAEADQALDTFRFHFFCRQHAADDGRRYYVFGPATTHAIVGLHHYVWGPPENVWLAWFAVDPDLQGRGFGTALLDAITDQAKQLGYMKLFIETYSSPDFVRACAFYRARGFTQAGQVEAYLPSGADMLVFYKDLTKNV